MDQLTFLFVILIINIVAGQQFIAIPQTNQLYQHQQITSMKQPLGSISHFDETARKFRESVAAAVRQQTVKQRLENEKVRLNQPETGDVPIEDTHQPQRQLNNFKNIPRPNQQFLNPNGPRLQQTQLTSRFNEPEVDVPIEENQPKPKFVNPIEPIEIEPQTFRTITGPPTIKQRNRINRPPKTNRRPIENDPIVQSDDVDPDLFERQAQSAHYSFDSSIQDTINDQSIVRQEKRDGLSLAGMYSYSDGFFKRTVHYEADENGYRVVKQEIEPIGDGPQVNPLGKADVSSSLSGSYSITADDVANNNKNKLSVKQGRQQQQNLEQRRPKSHFVEN